MDKTLKNYGERLRGELSGFYTADIGYLVEQAVILKAWQIELKAENEKLKLGLTRIYSYAEFIEKGYAGVYELREALKYIQLWAKTAVPEIKVDNE